MELSDEQRRIINSCIKGDREQFISLVDEYLKDSNDLNFYDDKGWTCLHHASHEGNIKIVRLLIGFNCNINVRNKRKRTALHVAIMDGYFDVTRILIEGGADVFLSDDEHNNAFHLCSSKGHYDLLKYLLENNQFTPVKNIFGKTAIDLAPNSKIKELLTEPHKKNCVINRVEAPTLSKVRSKERIDSNCVVNVHSINNYNTYLIGGSCNLDPIVEESGIASLGKTSNKAKPYEEMKSVSEIGKKIVLETYKKSDNQMKNLIVKINDDLKKVKLKESLSLRPKNLTTVKNSNSKTVKLSTANSCITATQTSNLSSGSSASPAKPKELKKAVTSIQFRNIDLGKLNEK